jgi:23S rRNA-/tRNA-specific pseudouridylate synthase
MPPEGITAEEMVSRLLYRDGLMLVIDKPPGIAVHRGPKGGASLEDYFGALRFGLPRPPALAHRLDRDTSGCLVLGRHRKALAQLGKLFKSGAIGKTYWAVVESGPDGDEGQIELPLGVDEARPRRTAGSDEMEGDGADIGAAKLCCLPPCGGGRRANGSGPKWPAR